MFYGSAPRYRMSLDFHRREIHDHWEQKERAILSHPETWRFTPTGEEMHIGHVPDNKNPFVYVKNLFPSLEKSIYETECLVIENSYFWSSTLKLPDNAAGLYVPAIGVILMCRNYHSHLIIDDVLVHELLHRVSHLLGRMHDESIEEEFAFSYSIDWFKMRYGKGFVLEKYLMPYCLYTSMQSLNKQKPDDETRKAANSLAERLYNFKSGEVMERDTVPQGDIWDVI